MHHRSFRPCSPLSSPQLTCTPHCHSLALSRCYPCSSFLAIISLSYFEFSHTHTNARYTLISMCRCRFQTAQQSRCRFQTAQVRDPPRVCLAQPANTRTSHRLSRAWRVRLMLRRQRGARLSRTAPATPARRGPTHTCSSDWYQWLSEATALLYLAIRSLSSASLTCKQVKLHPQARPIQAEATPVEKNPAK